LLAAIAGFVEPAHHPASDALPERRVGVVPPEPDDQLRLGALLADAHHGAAPGELASEEMQTRDAPARSTSAASSLLSL